MSDLDVIPYGKQDDLWGKGIENGDLSMFLITMLNDRAPCMVHSGPAPALLFLKLAIEHGLGNRPQDGRAHYSDQYSLEDLRKLEGITNFIKVIDYVKEFDSDGWQTAPAVHYANARMQPKGFIPRWQHIPRLRQ